MFILRKRVHFVHLSSRPGGIEVLLPVIIKAMPEWEFNAFVARRPAPGEPNVYDNQNISVDFGSKNNLKAVLKVFCYALKNRKDIFHVFNIGPVFLLFLRVAGVKKLIYSIHGTIYWKNNFKRIFLKFLWLLALSKKYKITSNTEYSRKVFHEKINKKSIIQVLYNPVDSNKFTLAPDVKRTGILKIIYSGRLCNGKNLETWLDIADQIHNLLPESVFEIYGSGPLRKSLESKIGAINAGSFIFLKGFRQDIENVYRDADLLLFLSEYESFGNVVVESILCGTPALVTDIPSMREIFRDFPEFILDSNEGLFKAVYSNLLNIKVFKERALLARGSFISRFSAEVHIEKLNKLYISFGE